MTEPSAEHVDTPGAEIVQFRPRNSLTAKVHYAKELAQSGLLPPAYRKNPANVLYAIEFGEALGVSPMTALVGVHVIDGKPTASAGLISALVRRAGHRLRVTGTDLKATAQIIRSDDPDFVFEAVWTIDRAKQAGLTGKGVWKNYPAAMLKARAITEVARDACEEALNGCRYTAEELGAEVNEEGEPTTIVEQVATPTATRERPASEVNWDAEITACGNDLAKLLALYKAAPDGPVRERIAELGKKLRVAAATPVEPEPITVDAELVEEPAPARTASRRPSKIADAKSASVHLDEMLANSDFDAAEGMAINAPRVDISGLLTSDVREILDVQAGEKIMLPEFGQIVADYISSHGYSVQSALDGDLPNEAA